jgi:hypothetical protein
VSNFPAAAGIITVLLAMLMLGVMLHRRRPGYRASLCAWFSLLNLGCALVALSVLPAGFVTALTAGIFSATAVTFLALEWRLGRTS